MLRVFCARGRNIFIMKLITNVEYFTRWGEELFLRAFGRLYGMEYAGQVVYKHNVITEFLIRSLGLDADTAETDACRIEHIISDETLQKMAEYTLLLECLIHI